MTEQKKNKGHLKTNKQVKQQRAERERRGSPSPAGGGSIDICTGGGQTADSCSGGV